MTSTNAPGPPLDRKAQENAEVIAMAIEALNVKDPELVEAFFDDEAEWRPALSADGTLGDGVYRGKREIVDYMKEVDANRPGAQIDVVRIDPVGPNQVLSQTRVRADETANGIALDVHVWGVWQVRDGKLTRGAAFLTEEEALEAGGLSK